MSDAPDPRPLDALAGRARARHVAVVGGGMAGLVVAIECAKVGLRVTLIEREERFGGIVRRGELDRMPVELGATAVRGGVVRALADDAGLGALVVSPDTDATWIGGIPGAGAAPFPAETVLGIPVNPWSDDVRRVIGWSGVWRAYLDRLRPPLTIGRERSLGRLVSSRMGARVRDRLVAPPAQAVHGIPPELVDVDTAVPGLSPALTRAGSLSGAAGELAAPRGPLETIVGGMSRLVDGMVEQLRTLDADLRPGTEVVGLDRAERGWSVRLAGGPAVGDADAAGSDAPGETTVAADGEPATVAADVVVVALPPSAARALLAPVVPELPAEELPAVEVDQVALAVDAPGLDAAARGARVLRVPGSGPAAMAEHESARWRWLRAGGFHVVRVTFPATVTADLSDADAVDLARREASVLLGVELPASAVRAAQRVRFASAPPATTLGHGAFADAVRAAVARIPGLAIAGGWVAGSGLGSVVSDAREQAERVRRVLLWGAVPPAG
ncbi:FAD-dependent oxidoreductase [Microbacterium sp. X-17]|uniref:protoporphyrinogen/coproporphyrinogen oxidase n=1 Tax=Microbacterium sp. X-17 TaxID=3144404 RepID=UPI0031F4DDC5